MLFNAGAKIELEKVTKIQQTIKSDFDIEKEYIQDSNSDELAKKQERFDAMNLMLDKIKNLLEIQARDTKLVRSTLAKDTQVAGASVTRFLNPWKDPQK